MYCIVLYCIALYCIVLYCIVLYCIVLYCIVLYCIVLYCIVLYCIVLYCIVLFQFTCGSFTALFYIYIYIYLYVIYIFVCGDFNANIRGPSQFGDDLLQLCSDNSLCLADALFLPSITFTFISSSHDTVLWLDHILTTTSGYSLFTDICVKSDFITSDHLPLCFTITVDNLNVPIYFSASSDALRYNWYGASDLDISNYYSCTRTELSRIRFPLQAMLCENVRCNKHGRDIDVFYSAITNANATTIKQCIPVLKLYNYHCVAGWNDHVSHHYNISRTDIKWWVAHNRPRHGPIYHAMIMSRAQFKYALRQCRLEERSITSTKLAYYMRSHDFEKLENKSKPNLHFLTVSQELLERLLSLMCGVIIMKNC